MLKLFTLFIALSLSCSVAFAGQITLTFEEQSESPVDGLTQSGVTFGFTESGLPSSNAIYGFPIFGFANLSGNVLEGPAGGTLTLTFAIPTSYLFFNVGVAETDAWSPGFTVQLTGPGNPIPSTSVDVIPIDVFAEGSFEYDNALTGALIKTATVTFHASQGSFFALDNLTFDATGGLNSIAPAPEPAMTALVGFSLLVAGAWARRRSLFR